MTESRFASSPRPVLAAAAVVALESLAAVVAAVALLVATLVGHPNDRPSALVGAVVALVLGAWVAWLAWGLARCRGWSRTPVVLVQFFAAVLAWNQARTLPALSVPLGLAVVAVVGLLLTPAARAALAR